MKLFHKESGSLSVSLSRSVSPFFGRGKNTERETQRDAERERGRERATARRAAPRTPVQSVRAALEEWKYIGASRKLLRALRFGFHIPWRGAPPKPWPPPRSYLPAAEEAAWWAAEERRLIALGAIRPTGARAGSNAAGR